MKFRFSDDAGASLGMVPPGEHDATIVSAVECHKPFLKGDGNPEGHCLAVTIDIEGFAPLEVPIDSTRARLAAAMCASAGVPCPAEEEDWDEGQLVGRSVRVRIEHKAALSTGATYARVAKWIGQAKPAKAAGGGGRRRPAATSADDGDLPF